MLQLRVSLIDCLLRSNKRHSYQYVHVHLFLHDYRLLKSTYIKTRPAKVYFSFFSACSLQPKKASFKKESRITCKEENAFAPNHVCEVLLNIALWRKKLN